MTQLGLPTGWQPIPNSEVWHGVIPVHVPNVAFVAYVRVLYFIDALPTDKGVGTTCSQPLAQYAEWGNRVVLLRKEHYPVDFKVVQNPFECPPSGRFQSHVAPNNRLFAVDEVHMRRAVK